MMLRIFLICVAFSGCGGLAHATEAIPYDIAIVGATVISPDRDAPMLATVYLDGDVIAAVEVGRQVRPARRVIDASGKYVIPGLIDSHVHVGHLVGMNARQASARKDLVEAYRRWLPRSYLYFGFTTLIDPDLSPDVAQQFDDARARPTLLGCGRGIRLLDGYGMNFVEPEDRFEVFPNFVIEPGALAPAGVDPDEHRAADAIDRVLEGDGICAKTYFERGFGGIYDLPVPSGVLLGQLARSALDAGLPLMVHATSDEGYAAALDAGANVLAHGLWHWHGALSPEVPPGVLDILDRVVDQGIHVQPTLQVILGEQAEVAGCPACDPRLPEALPGELVAFLKEGGADWSREELHALYENHELAGELTDEEAIRIFVERARATTAYLASKRAKLIFGTDTPATRGGGNVPGLNGHHEMAAWVEAGVPLRELFLALTLRNAQAFGLANEIGTISAGKRADLLVLSGNPLESVSAYDTIEYVVVGGKPVRRADLLLRPVLID